MLHLAFAVHVLWVKKRLLLIDFWLMSNINDSQGINNRICSWQHKTSWQLSNTNSSLLRTWLMTIWWLTSYWSCIHYTASRPLLWNNWCNGD